MLGLYCFEQSLFCSENLDCRGGAFGQVDQASRVADESGSHYFSHHCCEVGSQGLHSVLQVLSQVSFVVSQFKDLVTKRPDVLLVSLADFSSH